MIIRLQEVGSTNTFLREEMPDAPHGTVVSARCQSAGRGQRGNQWEAEPGMNLTFSILLRPHGIDARFQYAISEAVAIAIADELRALVPSPDKLAIKWPNDIYYGDMKLGGILIENSLTGNDITRTVVGAGINVNQSEFISDAPNPVSLNQLTGKTYNLDEMLENISQKIINQVDMLQNGHEPIHQRYCSMLWRKAGFFPYRTPAGDTFEARIAGVEPTGPITLLHRDGTLSTHAFKEVIAII